ncbi:MAG: diguanylate cyclase [Pseudomonadota bacterium]
MQSKYSSKKFLLICISIITLVCLIHYGVLVRAQNNIIEHEAIRIAEVVANQAKLARTVFSDRVVDKLFKEGFKSHHDYTNIVGAVPIPAQFLRFMSEKTVHESKGLYSYLLFSKWNLQHDQFPKDNFQKYAWLELEKQDHASPSGPINWHPISKIELVDGVKTLRYIKADSASLNRCIQCHNQMEKTPEITYLRKLNNTPLGKEFKLHQLIGAIEVRVPLDKVEAVAVYQSRISFALLFSTLVIGFSIALYFALREIKSQNNLVNYFEKKAQKDPLTGLRNRDFFNEISSLYISQAEKTTNGFSLFFIDLDNFKKINDSLGHEAGDFILKAVASRLSSCFRKNDLIFRQGGDEFLVLCQEEREEKLALLAQRVLKSLSVPIPYKSHELNPSASIGISVYKEQGYTIDQLVEFADSAMYESKKQGGNRYTIHTQL